MENPPQLLTLWDLFTIHEFPVIVKNEYFKLLTSSNQQTEWAFNNPCSSYFLNYF